MKRNYYAALGIAGTMVVLGAASALLEKKSVVHAAATMAPRFEVDPFWPKPLPNHWILGQSIGVSADAHDNIWIIHRVGSLEAGEQHATTNPPISQCCAPAPPVLEFDQEGNLIGHWGGPGPGYDWPESAHGITVDYKGNVWLGANGGGQPGPAPGSAAQFAAAARGAAPPPVARGASPTSSPRGTSGRSPSRRTTCGPRSRRNPTRHGRCSKCSRAGFARPPEAGQSSRGSSASHGVR